MHLSKKKKWNEDIIFNKMKSDKKSFKGNIQFILCKGIGQAFIKKNIDKLHVKKAILEVKN